MRLKRVAGLTGVKVFNEQASAVDMDWKPLFIGRRVVKSVSTKEREKKKLFYESRGFLLRKQKPSTNETNRI
jgi:hypothetical protein